jgi:hypothetical protein
MNKEIKRITRIVPFAAIIIVNSVAAFMLKTGHKAEDLKTFLVVISAVVLLNLILAVRKKTLTYFATAISTVTLLGVLSVFVYPQLGDIFLHNAIAALYIALFSSALFPPLFGIDPFTYEFSKKDYPEAVHALPQFKVTIQHKSGHRDEQSEKTRRSVSHQKPVVHFYECWKYILLLYRTSVLLWRSEKYPIPSVEL